MKNFTRGLLVGIGVGLLIAPMKGEELRHMLAERVEEWRNSLPEDSLINQYAHQLSDRVTATREHWREYAQHSTSTTKDAGMTMSDKAMRTDQERAGKTKQGAGSTKSTHGTHTRITPASGEIEG